MPDSPSFPLEGGRGGPLAGVFAGAAVRSGHASADTSTSWLTNDAFDYQTENRLPLPPNAPKYSVPRWLRAGAAASARVVARHLFAVGETMVETERGKV